MRLTWRESILGVLVPEPVSLAEGSERVGDDAGERRSRQPTVHRPLRYPTWKQIDVVHLPGSNIPISDQLET